MQTDARVAIAPHAMNQRKYGFYVVNKKVKKTGKKMVEGKTQQSLFELLEPQQFLMCRRWEMYGKIR